MDAGHDSHQAQRRHILLGHLRKAVLRKHFVQRDKGDGLGRRDLDADGLAFSIQIDQQAFAGLASCVALLGG